MASPTPVYELSVEATTYSSPLIEVDHTEPVSENDLRSITGNLDHGPFEIVTEPVLVSAYGITRATYDVVYHDIDGDVEAKVTEPARGFDKDPETPVIMTIPGCSEVIRKGTGLRMHQGQAMHHPGSWVVTPSSDGFNRHGKRFSAHDLLNRRLDHMASSRLRLAGDFAADEEVAIVAESMGGVIGIHMLDQNDSRALPVANITRTVLHNDAAVLPENTRSAMVGHFLPHAIRDAIAETVRHPIQASQCLSPRLDLLHPRTWVTLCGQVGGLLIGVDYATIDRVASNRIGLLPGSKDALLDQIILGQLRQDHGDTVLIDIANDGHMSTLKHRDTAKRIATMLRRLSELPQKTAAAATS